jgi:hypothetical protein
MFVLDGVPWSDQVAKAAKNTIPSSISEMYLAWDVHVWLGKRTIPDHQRECTVAETMCDVTVSGDGMPSDLNRYLELYLRIPEVIQLRETLAKVSGCTWDALISASY